MNKWVKLVLISILLISIDALTKYYIHKNVMEMSWLNPNYPYGGIGVFKDFFGISLSLNYVQNEGAAWGSFANYSTALFYSRIAIVIGLIVYLAIVDLPFKKLLPYWLVVTGAIGNILDRLFYGHVVDMIRFVFWTHSVAVFNFADALITVGIVTLLISSFFPDRKRTNGN
jgi:signal peptidase II